MIADLESQITELNSEMDELKEENNANLTVINRLKDSLQETTTRLVYILRTSPFHNLSFSVNLQALAHILVEFCLHYVDLQVCLDSDETGACRSPSPPCLSSTASLPSLPSGPTPALITYSRYEPGVPCLVPIMRFLFSGEDLQT